MKKAWEKPQKWWFFKEINNTHIGLLYIITGLLFFLGAGVLALLMRSQLAFPRNDLLTADQYNQFFTMHGTVMMFLFAVPIVEAVAVTLLPSMLGTRDMPFPRLSALGYWAYAIGGIMVFSSLFFGVAPDGGWFMYPPLTGPKYSPGLNTEIWILGLGFIEIAAVAAAVELIVGILKTRAPGMKLSQLPIFAWYMLVTAGMIMIGMPTVIAADILLELERAFDWPFYDASRGGDPLLWQHLFWLFGHPEVYIIFLPAAGMVSMMLPTFTRTPLVGYKWVVLAAVAIGFLSFGLWVHHMFTTGLPLISTSFFAAASSVIAIPMGIQVFAWLATLWEGKARLDTPMLYILGFLFIFVIGGLTGVMVAAVPFDWQVHDTYFVVAHFHYVLIGGMLFPLFAAFYYWMPAISRRQLSEKRGRIAFTLMFIGFNAAFFPMHFTGLLGMPRRVYTYESGLGWDVLNLTSTIFAFVFAAGVLLVFFDFVWHLRSRKLETLNVWQAPSLEWGAPLFDYGFRSLVPVDSRYPLWDNPDYNRQNEEGVGYLPDAPTVEREALITSPIAAQPEQILRLPGPGWVGFVSAVLTAIMFGAVTLKLHVVAAVAGLAALGAFLFWFWMLDRPMPRELADAGRGLALPLYQNSVRNVGWWGMVITIIADAAVLASFLFSYLFLWTARPQSPLAPGAALPANTLPIIATALIVAAAIAFHVAAKLNVRDKRAAALLVLMLSIAVSAVALLIGWQALTAMLPDPAAHSRAATTWALTGFVGVHVAIGAGMAGWCALRMKLRLIDSWCRATVNNCLLWWWFTAAAAIISLLVIAGFPHVAP